jgi:hypothetical protein
MNREAFLRLWQKKKCSNCLELYALVIKKILFTLKHPNVQSLPNQLSSNEEDAEKVADDLEKV